MSNINSQNYKIPDDSLRNQIEHGVIDSVGIIGPSFFVNTMRLLENDLLTERRYHIQTLKKPYSHVFYENLRMPLLNFIYSPSNENYSLIDIRIVGVLYFNNNKSVVIGFSNSNYMTVNYRVYTANYKILKYFHEVIEDKLIKKTIKEHVKCMQEEYCW